MEQYIKQLIEDLTEASQNIKPVPDYTLLNPNHPAIEYGLDYIVAWECAPDIPIEQFFEIPSETFPPSERLTTIQQTAVLEAILNLWEVYHIEVLFPDDAPVHMQYDYLRRLWKENTIQHIGEGCMTFEYCDYDPEVCFWGETYCSCKHEDWYKDENDEEISFDPDTDCPF